MQSSSAMSSAPIAGLRARVVAKRVARRNVDRAIRAVSTERSAANNLGNEKLRSVAGAVAAGKDVSERLKALIARGGDLPALPESDRAPSNRVMGCTSQAWIDVSLDADGKVLLRGHSDAQITTGFAGVLAAGLGGLSPEDVLGVDDDVVKDLGLGASALPRSRANGFRNMLESVKKQTRLLRDGRDAMPFPSLLVTADGIEARGPFAEAQANYLEPDAEAVAALVKELKAKKIGVVAHFYMDPQVQGVLMAAAKEYEHVFISDSLVMADAAVKMVEAGCDAVCVLGVDFMSENVRAILDDAGHADAKVYRMAAEDIGCSLAEAAQSDAYYEYLAAADGVENAVHVIYINTALDTKANADAIVPTVTCTSSNVVQTVLQAAAQVPGVNIFYGPDTYMGGNLAELFTMMSTWTDEEVAAVHPAHSRATIKALLPRLRYFQDGTCMVHHMFGGDVCDTVRKFYGDAYQTAHFEVPGEMFKLAMEAKRERDMGVVGSTKNILDFVVDRVDDAIARKHPNGERLSFVLGTETGMVTSIVRAAQARLKKAKADGVPDVECEIVFPVSAAAVTATGETQAPSIGGLAVVPGPAGGEGCSSEGGCASCPYMKMNSLDALMRVCARVGTEGGAATLAPMEPKKYAAAKEGEKSVAARGCVPILHMRDFTRDKKFSDAFVNDIVTRAAGGKK
jgi:quinolinate synthase